MSLNIQNHNELPKTTQEIIFIIFSEFSGNIIELIRSRHVWLEKSERNMELAGQLVKDKKSDLQTPGVTLFNDVGPDKANGLYRYLSTIGEHHCKWHKLIAVGAKDDSIEQIREELDEDACEINIEEKRITITRL